MKKVSIISPIYKNVQNLASKIDGLAEFFQDKYDYQVLCYYSGQIAGAVQKDKHFVYYRIEEGQTYDDCVRDGFSRADGDAIIVADINNEHYLEYIQNLLIEWEKNAEIVLVKREKESLGFFQKIGRFFVNLYKKMQDFVLSLFGYAKDYKAMRTFQLFDKNASELIKAFPQKNYYLRNFDCWQDYNVSVLRSAEDVAVDSHEKVWTKDLIVAVSSFGICAVLILVLALTAGLIENSGRAMYVLIGIGLILTMFLFGAKNFLAWFVGKKIKIKNEFKKENNKKSDENDEKAVNNNEKNENKQKLLRYPIKKLNKKDEKRKITIQKIK